MEEISEFIRGLKLAKNIYVECPFCSNLFSLHSSRLVYGKEPPKDILSKSEKQIKNALNKYEVLQEKYDEDIDQWELKLEGSNDEWRNKLALQYERWNSEKNLLNEKIKHIKTNIAVAQKEIIKEKVDKALLSQRGVIEGHIAELFPLFKKTRINPADLCGLIPTSPMDFIVFDGLFKKEVSNIVFLDVKKGSAQLSHVQKTIRDTIQDGNVEFKKLRVDFDKVKGTATEED